jgi:vitamin B12 transporter
MMRRIVFFFAMLALIGSPVLFAADGQKVDKPRAADLKYDIVVTATRVETPNREVASSVLVLTRTDLQRTRKTFVVEALQELAGLTVQENGPMGSAATVMLRGANSEHTLVMMDGVEVNDPISPSRSFDFGHLRVENIERIEVILGPQSPLYGSDALGGVVNIITRRGEGKPGLSLSALGGSYGTAGGQAGFSGSRGPVNYSLGASVLTSTGFSAASSAYRGNTEKDGYKNLSLSGRLGYSPRDNLDFDLILRGTLARTSLDSFGGDYGDDPNSRQNYGMLFIKGQARTLLLRNRWEQRLSVSSVSHDRSYDNPVDILHPFDSETGMYMSQQATVDWQNTIYAHETNTVTFGLEFQREQGRSDYSSNSMWGPSESLFPQKNADTAGVYIQDQVKLGGHFFAAVGGRLDHHSQFGQAFTYRLAPAYVIEATQTKLKATLGTGFKSPSLYQLYAPGTFWGPIGNRDLKPETSTGWDAGVEQTLIGGRLTVGLTYFRNDFRNLIQFDYLRGYTNTGRAESKGLEPFASARLVSDIVLQAAYTRTDTLDKTTGLNLLRRPADKLTAGVTAPLFAKTQLVVSLIAVGPRADMAYIGYTAARVQLKGYALLNAVISRDVGALGRVFLRLDNILDQNYETIYGYGMPHFSIYAGFSLGN